MCVCVGVFRYELDQTIKEWEGKLAKALRSAETQEIEPLLFLVGDLNSMCVGEECGDTGEREPLGFIVSPRWRYSAPSMGL